MSLTIEPGVQGSLHCLRLAGRLDTSTSPELQKAVETLLADASVAKLALDFGGVQYVSSAGLRVLLIAMKTLKARHGALILCAVREEVKQVLKISGFQAFLTLAASLEEAAKG